GEPPSRVERHLHHLETQRGGEAVRQAADLAPDALFGCAHGPHCFLRNKKGGPRPTFLEPRPRTAALYPTGRREARDVLGECSETGGEGAERGVSGMPRQGVRHEAPG